MSVHNFFKRIAKNEEYIIQRSTVYDIIEVDYSKALLFQKGETISFRHIKIFKNFMNDPHKGDYGVYYLNDFNFIFNAVDREYNQSYREVNGLEHAVLFLPEKIKFVVDIILNDLSSFSDDANANEVEIENMKKLGKMLEEAISENDYILSEVG